MRNNSNRNHQAFTLIELLVVISIIGFMSGMFIVAYRGASQESNAQKTRTTLQKISYVLNSRMEEYSSYPLVLKTPLGFPLPGNTVPISTSDSKTLLLERARLLCLRELIAMEMPDHPDDFKWSDKWVTNQPMTTWLNSVPKVIPTGLAFGAVPVSVQNKPTSRVFGLARKLSDATGRPIKDWQKTNANAELLYLVIEDSELDGSSAIELFGASETKDTDNDGLKEIVDSFGNPIQWIRWPSGYEGIARYHPDMLDPGIITGSIANPKVTIESDPLDRMSADPGFATVASAPGPGAFPLVMSAGNDGKFGIRFESASAMNGTTSFSVIDAQWSGAPTYLNGARFTDPWYPRSAPADRLGSRVGPTSDSQDNLSNYDGNGASL
jgi:prepilin-type N-terminal cleavage/methylation domain-containing protein